MTGRNLKYFNLEKNIKNWRNRNSIFLSRPFRNEKVFFCFIPIKISQSVMSSKDGSKFSMTTLVYSKKVSVCNNLCRCRYFKSNNQNLFPFMLLPPEEAPKALTADPTSGDLFSWSLMFKTRPSCSIPPKIRALWTNDKKCQHHTLILASYFSWKGLDHKVAQDTCRNISASYEAFFF